MSHLSEWVNDLKTEEGLWAVYCPQSKQFVLNPALAKLAGSHGVNGCSKQIANCTTGSVQKFEGEINGRNVVVTAMTDRCSGFEGGVPVVVARVRLKA